MKKHNFSAGPSILPQEVFQEAAESLVNYNNSGLSILEISHRSQMFIDIMDEAVALVKKLLVLPDNYHPIFLSGGATSQFYMTAMNFLNEDETAAYIDTGVWSVKAIKDGGLYGNIVQAASSEDENYAYIPKSINVTAEAKYLHLTTNNTIYGTQFHEIPTVDIPIVADMSSDIFSRKLDIEKYGVIYAGAQKNTGAAGTTLVIIREDMLKMVKRELPVMLKYENHIKKNSALNTPPVFPIYVSLLNLRWLDRFGGVEAIRKLNEAKAALIYQEIDRNSLFIGNVKTEDRSIMNATFNLKDQSLTADFLAACDAADIVGIKGHRLSGGFRASMYNALKLENVQALVDVMAQFEADRN